MRVIDDCSNRRREDNNTSRLNLASTLNFAQSIIWSAMAIHQEVLGEVGKGGSSRKLKEGEIDIGLIVKKGSCLHQKLSIKFAFLIQITNFTICYLILQPSNSRLLSLLFLPRQLLNRVSWATFPTTCCLLHLYANYGISVAHNQQFNSPPTHPLLRVIDHM